jgi:hypothetical protein
MSALVWRSLVEAWLLSTLAMFVVVFATVMLEPRARPYSRRLLGCSLAGATVGTLLGAAVRLWFL